ncbi:MAG: CheR family methyltransferase, partial [Phycisphaeraceae bacterium]
MEAVSGSDVTRFRTLFAQRTGIELKSDDTPHLDEFLQKRIRANRLPDGASYLRRLEEHSPRSREEWRVLLGELTVPESFFFRDRGQHEVLRSHLLPGIIREKRDNRELRIWSAGCSRGEEIYSIAILLRELIPDLSSWQLTLVGTDINPAAIEVARRATYSRWSLRNLDAQTTARYFQRAGDQWRLDPRIAGMVEFHVGNLLADDYPSTNGPLHGMDLILCRNVFIYMAPTQVGRIVDKIIRTLRPGGALVTGHSEIQGVAREGLVSQHLPGSTVHFRQPTAKRRPPKPPTWPAPHVPRAPRAPSQPSHRPPTTRPAPVISRPPDNRATRTADIGEAERLFDKGEYRRALDTLGQLSPRDRSQPRTRRLETRIHLQLDDLQAARDAVESLLSRPGRQAEDYFLLALIQQAGDDTAQA